MRRHGVYVWGSTWIQAKTQAECYDYLFEAALKMKAVGVDASQPATRAPAAVANGVAQNGHAHGTSPCNCDHFSYAALCRTLLSQGTHLHSLLNGEVSMQQCRMCHIKQAMHVTWVCQPSGQSCLQSCALCSGLSVCLVQLLS